MNHPFWLINSSLVFLMTFTLLFVYFSRPIISTREDTFTSVIYNKPRKQQHIAINIKHIYENDLFDTYQKELIPTLTPEIVVDFPEPPQPQQAVITQVPQPKFLEPLNVTLKGVIFISSDEEKNRALISLNKTNQENSYKVGMKIEDAQLIRIFNNKVIFLRPNGQQEVLYLRDEDAKIDPAYALMGKWESVVHKKNNIYYVNSDEFIKRIKNIAEFIDVFGLTTVYQKGQSIGTRIGTITDNSLGKLLGFVTGDIIISINNTTCDTVENRLKIYNTIIDNDESKINVCIMRNNKEIDLHYVLQSNNYGLYINSNAKNNVKINDTLPDSLTQEKIEKDLFASTLKKISNNERQNMSHYGKKPFHV